MEQAQAKETSNSIQFMAVDTTLKMRDAKANKRIHEYFTYFKFDCQLLNPHVRSVSQQKLQSDFTALKALEKQIDETSSSEMNPATKQQQLEKVLFTFADNREFYIFDTLPKIGLGRDLEEGVIDFEKTDIDDLALAVRNIGAGLQKSVKPITGV